MSKHGSSEVRKKGPFGMDGLGSSTVPGVGSITTWCLVRSEGMDPVPG